LRCPPGPPLANVLTAAFMQMTRSDYAHYQIITTVLCSLAYLPVGLLAGRFGGRRAARIAAVLVMLNPLFLQNSTYPWTKLMAVFFILTGLYFFLRVRDEDEASGRAAVVCALCLAGAVVTHYSAGPYVATLAVLWIAMGFQRGWRASFAWMTVVAVLAGACVLAPWFSWSVAEYGWAGTFLSNSSVIHDRNNMAGQPPHQDRPQHPRHPDPAPGERLPAGGCSGSPARGEVCATSFSWSIR
jgi:4-amino-4-deoxy-L-arabinose transferase-like glycosyltransferase